MFNSVSSRSASAYRQIGVESRVAQASPHQLVDMLFDGLVQAINQARGALERGDIPNKGKFIGNAVRIIEEGLKGGLNMQAGGEIASNLNALYAYCTTRLTQANARNDAAALTEVLELIKPVAEGWKLMGQAQAPEKLAA